MCECVCESPKARKRERAMCCLLLTNEERLCECVFGEFCDGVRRGVMSEWKKVKKERWIRERKSVYVLKCLKVKEKKRDKTQKSLFFYCPFLGGIQKREERDREKV